MDNIFWITSWGDIWVFGSLLGFYCYPSLPKWLLLIGFLYGVGHFIYKIYKLKGKHYQKSIFTLDICFFILGIFLPLCKYAITVEYQQIFLIVLFSIIGGVHFGIEKKIYLKAKNS